MDFFALFHSFCQVHSATMLRQLSAIIAGALCAPHTITMRNIARWSTYSYRTVQRVFAINIYWPSLHTAFVMTHLYEKSHTCVLAYDETTTTKSGKKHTELISVILVHMGMLSKDSRLRCSRWSMSMIAKVIPCI